MYSSFTGFVWLCCFRNKGKVQGSGSELLLKYFRNMHALSIVWGTLPNSDQLLQQEYAVIVHTG